MTVVASACCCGQTCRWHGRPTRKSKTIRDLEARGIRVVPVCPEMLGGLLCPRPPVRSRRGTIWQTDKTRTALLRDVTDAFRRGAALAVQEAKRVRAAAAYLFRLSPSCAPGGIAGRAFAAAGIEVVPIW